MEFLEMVCNDDEDDDKKMESEGNKEVWFTDIVFPYFLTLLLFFFSFLSFLLPHPFS